MAYREGGELSEAAITARQMRRLQTLWGLLCKQVASDEWRVASKNREARLGWVSGAIGRQIGSFRELTLAEAKTAIQAVQKHLPPELLRKRRPSRNTAQAYGTAGRLRQGYGGQEQEIRLADAETWALLDRLLGQLGWTRERLDAFLRSAKSPTRGRLIRTLADANRVIWALKAMLRSERSPEDGGRRI